LSRQILILQGLSCPHCTAKILEKVRLLPEVKSADYSLPTERLTLETEADIAVLQPQIEAIVKALEPEVEVLLPKNKAHQTEKEKGLFGIAGLHFADLLPLLVCLIFLIAALVLPVSGTIKQSLYLLSWLPVGLPILMRTFRGLRSGNFLDENFLMTIASVGAFLLGDYTEGIAVMLLFTIGELFEHFAVDRSRRSIASLLDIRPESAAVLRGEEFISVAPQEVAVGETILIRPGERIPLDCVLLEGETTLDTSALTGESLPREATAGDTLLSGCINLTGVVKARTTQGFETSTVARILEMVEQSSENKAQTESFISKFARWYTPLVVGAAVLLALLPPLFRSLTFAESISRALTFLVISCPCALVISVPLSYFSGIGAASRVGVLIKGSNHLETLAATKTLVFDKTGTLTHGRFAVASVLPVSTTAEELLRLAAAAEQHSSHPIALSLRKAADAVPAVQDVREISGKGVLAVCEGKSLVVGNAALLAAQGIPAENPADGTCVHVAADGQYLGCITLEDTLKPDTAEALSHLRRLGVEKTVLLTGDRADTAQKIAAELSIDDVRSDLLPAQKVEQLEGIIEENNTNGYVAFVGDGINDAPVLARADLGIAMGALGSDAAIEAADVVLMNDSLSSLEKGLRLARRTRGIVVQNIVFSLAVKGIVLLLGAFGYASMWLAVFADVGVAMIAILNAMRAGRIAAPAAAEEHTHGDCACGCCDHDHDHSAHEHCHCHEHEKEHCGCKEEHCDCEEGHHHE